MPSKIKLFYVIKLIYFHANIILFALVRNSYKIFFETLQFGIFQTKKCFLFFNSGLTNFGRKKLGTVLVNYSESFDLL